MPEGDTIARTARTLDRWLTGREITAASTTVADLPARWLVGRRIESVEARAKHLLMRLDSGSVLHTHMRMTGSWHVYPKSIGRWRKPAHQARLVLEAGDRVAVCFNAPVVELLAPRAEQVHPALKGLGPDVLVDPLDLTAMVQRARRCPDDTPVGELLIDQRVVSGIGNIWRCESLFARRVHPDTSLALLSDGDLEEIVRAASEMMRASAATNPTRTRRWVYGRNGRPCRRCRERIALARTGAQGRVVYWCPACQPSPP